MNTYTEISLRDIPSIIRKWIFFLLSKWVWILSIGLIFALAGMGYAWLQKPLYTAEITFAPENDNSSSMGMYAGLASQFGIDIGGGGGGVFEGENLMEFLKSRMLIEKTLLSPIDKADLNKLIIHHYIEVKNFKKEWSKDEKLKNLIFTHNQLPMRMRDSIMNRIVKDIHDNLIIQKQDKRLDIISARVTDNDELFAKMFIENLVGNGVEYFVDYRSKKTRDNVRILQRQTDSVKSLLRGGIASVAGSNDLNVNPIRQIVRVTAQKQQVDVQANTQVYGELLKQLELAKISLRKEIPLVQVIDSPRFPLEKKKMGRLKGVVLFGFLGVFLSVIFLSIKRFLSGSEAKLE